MPNYKPHPFIEGEIIDIEMSSREQEEQRRSFAYGNLKLSNPDITREQIDDAANLLEAERIIRKV